MQGRDKGTNQPLWNAEKGCESHLTYLRIKAAAVVSRSCSTMNWSVGKAKNYISILRARERL